jgi:hypothetical protein
VVDPSRPAEPPAPPPHTDSLLSALQALWRELPGLVSDRVELLSLELHRAGVALAQIVAMVVVAAILGVTAWLALWTGVVLALLAAGLHWAIALVVVLVVNVVSIWLAIARVKKLAPLLKLPATRRHLTITPSTEPKPVEPQARPRAADPLGGASAG